MKICILIYASKRFGYGHLFRGLRLAKALENFSLFFLTNNNSISRKRLAEEGMSFYVYNTFSEIDNYLSDVDCLILDKLNTHPSTIKKVKKRGIKVLALDDNGRGARFCDAIINAIVPLPKKRPDNCFSGISFFVFPENLIRLSERGKKPINSGPIRRVFACFGGSDPNDISSLIPELCALMPNIHFDLALGPGYEKKNAILSSAVSLPNIHVVVGENDLSHLEASADLCLVSGGLTLYECVYLKKRTIVLCQVDHQCRTALSLAKDYPVISLGIVTARTPSVVGEIKNLIVSNRFPNCDCSSELENGVFYIKRIIENLVEGEINK